MAAPGTQHQGFPVQDRDQNLVGVVTRRDLFDGTEAGGRRIGAIIKRAPVVVYEDSSLREAVDHMVEEGVGRLPVVLRAAPPKVVGLLTRSDLLATNKVRIESMREARRVLHIVRRNGRRAVRARADGGTRTPSDESVRASS